MAHIGEGAFQNDDSVEGISLGEFVTTGKDAFEECTSLASISLDTSVAHLGGSAFPD